MIIKNSNTVGGEVKMNQFYIGLDKDNQIVAATLDVPNHEVQKDIEEFKAQGLKVLHIEAESITIGSYWNYSDRKSKVELPDCEYTNSPCTFNLMCLKCGWYLTRIKKQH